MFCPKLKDESGMVMIVIMAVTLVSTILTTSYMGLVIHESREATRQKHRVQSLFLAEAGLEKSLYYLNNIDDPENPWVDDEGQMLATPLEYEGNLAEGCYEITLYDQNQLPSLPDKGYLVESTGIIPRLSGKDIKRRVSCIVDNMDELPIPAALSILDDADVEIELDKFASNSWTIDGEDMDDWMGRGLYGIAVANTEDDVELQLGARLDAVTGADDAGTDLVGIDAILEDPDLPKNLDAYANYFEKIAIDVSSPDGHLHTIPEDLLGTETEYQVLYADLSKGPLKLAGQNVGNGVLVLEGTGEFEMAGNSTWNGVIICASESNILLKGGGATPAHIYGALLIADGTVEMNGTADIQYSSDNTSKINAQLLLYQVYSWCEGWGIPIGAELDV